VKEELEVSKKKEKKKLKEDLTKMIDEKVNKVEEHLNFRMDKMHIDDMRAKIRDHAKVLEELQANG